MSSALESNFCQAIDGYSNLGSPITRA